MFMDNIKCKSRRWRLYHIDRTCQRANVVLLYRRYVHPERAKDEALSGTLKGFTY